MKVMKNNKLINCLYIVNFKAKRLRFFPLPPYAVAVNFIEIMEGETKTFKLNSVLSSFGFQKMIY